MTNRTSVKQTSDRELVVTRVFSAPAHLVFKAWTTPELFRKWWIPQSLGMTLLACEMDVRTGGGYRLEFKHGDGSMAFFGKYLDVVPPSRIVWTNEESDDSSITTVTLEDRGRTTLLTLHEVYPSREAFERARGAEEGLPEQFEQLDALLLTLA